MVDAQRVSFERVTTDHGLGQLDFVLAVADFNGDGRDDILAGGRDIHRADGQPEDRRDQTPIHVFLGRHDGRFRHAPRRVRGRMNARDGRATVADFNEDGWPDVALFDVGTYVGERSLGFGNPPELYLSNARGVLRRSNALAAAVRREHARRPNPEYSGPADLHVKTAPAVGDIDGDGDLDLWVESTGGANVPSHFLINNGQGRSFTLDPDRVSGEVLRNNPPEYWRHVGNALVDVDNDGDLDLVLGQIQDDNLRWRPYSIVLPNDGTGHFSSRIELPDPAFNRGHTAAQALTHFDLNDDGHQDLLLLHERDGPANVISFTGRYIQVLINRDGGTSFGDETRTWIGGQGATRPQRRGDGTPLYNAAQPTMRDVDRDGCLDLVMSRAASALTRASPLLYRNNGSGRFRAMPPAPFTGGDRHFGFEAVPLDVNGDGAVDFVVPRRGNGPDGRYGTDDDYTTFVTLLNTTPLRPIRCNG